MWSKFRGKTRPNKIKQAGSGPARKEARKLEAELLKKTKIRKQRCRGKQKKATKTKVGAEKGG